MNKVGFFKTSKILKRTFWYVALVCVVLSSFGPVTTANAAIPKYINFQGKLTKVSDGTNVSNGTYAFEFKLYDASTAGTLLWTETYDQPSGACGKLTVTNAIFNAKLGSCNSLSGVDFTGGSLYLSVNFAPTGTSYDGEMSPRKQLVASPFAFIANGVSGDGKIDIASTGANQATIGYDGTNKLQINIGSTGFTTLTANGAGAGFNLAGGNVGIGTTTTSAKLHVQGDGLVSSSFNVYAGTTGNAVLKVDATGANSNGAVTIGAGGIHSQQIKIDPRGTSNWSTVTSSGSNGLYLSNGTGYIILSGNNVGIGTTSPAAILAVGATSQFQVNSSGAIAAATGITSSGTITFSGLTAGGVVQATAGTGVLTVGTLGASAITADALDFTEFKDAMTLDASTDIAVTGSNVFSITNSGSGNSLVVNDAASDTSPFVIDAAGNVGIGTTTIGEKITATGVLNLSDVYLRFGANTGSSITNGSVYNPSGQSIKLFSNTGIEFGDNSGTISSKISGGGGSSYFNAGNVGIGTTAPTSALHVVAAAQTVASSASAEYTTSTFTAPTITLTGTTQVTSTMDSFLFNQPTLTDASAVTVDKAATLTIAGAPISAGSVTLTDSYGLKINTASVTAATRATSLYVDAPTGATSNYAAVFASGNVGIGTTAPASLMHIHAANGAPAFMSTRFISGSNYAGSAIYHTLVGGTTDSLVFGVSGDDSTSTYTIPTDSSQIKMVIRKNGNVGIGTTTPAAKLAITGTGTSSAKALSVFDSGNVERMSVLDNGNITIPGYVSVGNGNTCTYCLASNFSSTFGISNTNAVNGNRNSAFGFSNTVLGATNSSRVSLFGSENTTASNATIYANVSAFGYNNTISATTGASIFGHGITNAIDNSTMIGPSDSAKVTILSTGNVGIGTTTVSSLLDIGSGTPTTAASGLNFGTDTSANLYRSASATIKTDGTFNAATALQIGGVSINTAGTLSNVAYLNQVNTFTANNIFQPTVTTGTGATAGIQIAANSLTTGNGVDISSTSLTTGNVAAISSTSTAGGASGTSTLLNLSRSGANANAAHTAYGLYSTVTNTNATSGTNIAAYLSASGATTANYGLIVAAGNVGIGTTSPTAKLHIQGSTGSTYMQLENTDTTGFAGVYGKNNAGYISEYGVVASAQSQYLLLQANEAYTYTNSAAFNFQIDNNAGTFRWGIGATTTPKMVLTSTGNVGIGTTSPGSPLTVQASASGAMGIGIIGRATADASNIYFYTNAGAIQSNVSSDSSAGLTISQVSNLGMHLLTNNTERLTILSGGNVGIGTTSPSSLLNIVGSSATVNITGTTNNQLLSLNMNTTAGTAIGGIQAHVGTGEVKVGAFNASYFSTFYSNGSEAMRITTGGNVGIGTTSPLALLHVSGANQTLNAATPDAYGNLFVASSDAYAADKGGMIALGGKYGASATYGGIIPFARLSGRKEGASNNYWDGYLAFETTNNSTGIVERMRITSTGNVGIGTTNPLSRLVVQSGNGANILTISNTSAKNVVALHANSDGGGVMYAYDTNGNITGAWGEYGTLASGNLFGWTNSATNALGTLDTVLSRSAANTLRLSSDGSSGSAHLVVNGNVGIGTTSPGEKLDVSGRIRITGSNNNLILQDAFIPATINGDNVGFIGKNLYDNSGTWTAQDTARVGWGIAMATGGSVPNFSILYHSGGTTTPTPSTRFTINTSGNVGIGTTSPGGQLQVNTASASTKGIIVKASASQTANLIDVQDSTGTTVAGINKDGSKLILTSAGEGIVVGDSSSNVTSGSGALAVGTFVRATANQATAVGSYNVLASGIASTAIGSSASVTANFGTAVGYAANDAYGSIAIGRDATTTAANQLVIGSSSVPTSNVFFGQGVTNASPAAYTINGTGGSGTDITGGSLQLAAGKATGNAAGGDILFQTSDAGSTGTTLQSLTTKLTIKASGNVGIGTTAPAALLQVNSAVGGADALILRDTTNSANARFYFSAPIGAAADLNISASRVIFPGYSIRTGRIEGTSGSVNVDAALTVTSASTFSVATSVANTTIFSGGVSANTIIRPYSSSYNVQIAPDGGNVGIGTTSPGAIFQININGSAANPFSRMENTSFTNNAIQVYETGGTNILSTHTVLQTAQYSSTNGGAVMIGASDNAVVPAWSLYGINEVAPTSNPVLLLSATKGDGSAGTQALAASDLLLQVENAGTAGIGSGTKVLTILGGGNVGIGTTTVSSLLDIGSGTPTTAASGLNFGTDTSANLYRSASATIKTDGTFNAATALQIGGVSINTAGTLSNLAYLNQANTFSTGQTINVGSATTSLSIAQPYNANAISITKAGNSTAINITSTSASANGVVYSLTDAGTSLLNANTLGVSSTMSTGFDNYSTTAGNFSATQTRTTAGSNGDLAIGVDATATSSIATAGTYGYAGRFTAGSANITPLLVKGASSQTSDLFQIQNSGGTSLLTVNSNGNVGIGTTSPGGILDVSGTSNAIFRNSSSTTMSTSYPHVLLRANSGSYPEIGMVYSSGAADSKIWSTYADATTLYGRVVNDAQSGAANYLQVVRSGYTISSVSFPNGNVGIGSTSPGAQLDVVGASSTIPLRLTSATPAANKGALQIEGTYESTGRTAINIITSTSDAAAIRFMDTSNQTRFGFTYNAGNTATILQGLSFDTTSGTNSQLGFTNTYAPNAANTATTYGYDFKPTLNAGASNSGGSYTALRVNLTQTSTTGLSTVNLFDVQVGGSSKLLVKNDGNVGIGTSTPASILQISNATSPAVKVTDSDFGTGTSDGLDLQMSGAEAYLWNYENGGLTLATNNTSRLYITNGGNVGIGTTSANALLHIKQSQNSQLLTAVENVNTGTTAYAELQARNGTSDTDAIRVMALGTSWTTTGPFVQDAGALITDSTLSGGLSIGTRTTADIRLYTNSTQVVTAKNGGVIQFNTYGAGTLSTDASGNITASSDARLKTLQGTFNAGLAQILNIHPVLYKWNELSGMETNGIYAGFVAQDIQSAIPEAVSTDGRGYLTLSDRPILAATINAVKELNSVVVKQTSTQTITVTTLVDSGLALDVRTANTSLLTIDYLGTARFTGTIIVKKDVAVLGRVLGSTAIVAKNTSNQTIHQGDLVMLTGATDVPALGDNPTITVSPAIANGGLIVGIADRNLADFNLDQATTPSTDPTEILPGEFLSIVITGTYKKAIVDGTVAVGDKLTASTTPGHVAKLEQNTAGQMIGISLDAASAPDGSIRIMILSGFQAAPAVAFTPAQSPTTPPSQNSNKGGNEQAPEPPPTPTEEAQAE